MDQKKFDISSSKLLDEMGIADQSHDVQLLFPSSVTDPKDHSILFCVRSYWKDEFLENLRITKDALIILESGMDLNEEKISDKNHVIYVDDPKLFYISAIKKSLDLYQKSRTYRYHENFLVTGENVVVGKNVIIEPFVFIDHDVVIGNDTIIKKGSTIRSNVTIGSRCVIGEQSVIGAPGLSLATDDKGQHHRIPHLGGVVIEDDVEIGAYNTIASGTINPTKLMRYVMTGERNQISHNSVIGKGTLVSGNVVITGSVRVGEYCWLGPNSTIINSVSIGNKARVSIGSVVFKDVADGTTVIGNPARVLSVSAEVSSEPKVDIPNMYNRKD